MSRILRRPMFRGGRVDSRGTGITTGLMDGGRVGFYRGGGTSYLTLPEPVTSTPIGRTNAMQAPGITGISLSDFFKPVSVTGQGFSEYRPGDRIRQAEREKFPMYDEFMEETEETPEGVLLASTNVEGLTIPKQKNKSEGDVELDLPTSTIEEEISTEPEGPVRTPKVNEPDTEVTMTDLERALGLDDAKKEYVGDALAAASKAFFEGKGFGAISDAAAVKSKAPDIKRLAGLEQFKADKAQKLYETKLKAAAEQKAGTKGNLQKDIEYLGTLSGADRIAALGKLGYKAPSLSAAIKEMKMEGQSPDSSTIESLAALYIGPDFKGVISGDDKPEKDGKYITADGTTLLIIEEGVSRIQKL